MSFDDVLKGLRQDYLHSLPQKISDIRRQIKAGSAEDLLMSFHKLKGTGKTYGIPEITELAAVVEHICQDAPAKAAPAADQAVSILVDIHSARTLDAQFPLENDPRFKKIQNAA
jgi:chemotaxis protein histidine kinase CheA